MPKTYFVYILTNKTNKVLYVGVTNNLEKRVFEHKNNISEKSFTATYNVHKLVYFEETSDINSALNREKQIKAGSRQKKLDLINKVNPEWKDLLEGLGY